MAKPNRDHADKVRGAMAEIVSGLSALNMEPYPASEEEIAALGLPEGHPIWLSHGDKWVAHAYEHFLAAFDMLKAARDATAPVGQAVEIEGSRFVILRRE